MEENEMEEWEIVNYCTSAAPNYLLGSEEEDGIVSYIDDDVERSKQLKLGWLVSSGVSLGKKLVVTGLLISSAPLVVPPLVVVSALGCALSLPFGVVFASYVCTDSLMSKLLLPSPPPLMLECDYEKTDEDEQEQEQDVDQVAFEYHKEEEEEQRGVKDAVEMRIELVDTHEDESVDGIIDLQPQQQTENAAKTTDEKKGQENVNVGGGSGEDVSTLQIQTAEDRKPPSKEVGEEVAAVDRKEVDHKDVEKTVAATVKLGTTSKDAIKGSTIGGSKGTERRGKRKTLSALKFPRKRQESAEGDKRHIEKPSLNEKTDQTSDLADRGKLGLGEKQSRPDELGEQKAGETNDIIKRVLEKEEKPVGLKDGVENIESSLEKEEKPAGMKEMSKEGQSVEDDERSTTKYTATEIAATDGGIDEKTEHRSVTIYSDPGEKDNQSGKIAVDGDHSLEIGASLAVVPELKHDEVMIPEVKGEKDANLVDSGLRTSDEDEKIRKKMDAIRVIVGYKAPRRGSYVEELKALYLFTGIEPPADSADFHNKLCFLMSVIGLK